MVFVWVDLGDDCAVERDAAAVSAGVRDLDSDRDLAQTGLLAITGGSGARRGDLSGLYCAVDLAQLDGFSHLHSPAGKSGCGTVYGQRAGIHRAVDGEPAPISECSPA